MKRIYFDHAAATPLDDKVFAAMRPYLSEQFYNPSATYLAARVVHDAMQAARAKVAGILGAKPAEIIFTAGGTEANNLAVHGIMRRFPGKKMIVSSIEHESVLAPARQYQCVEAPVMANGILDVAALEQLIDDDTVLVSVMHANNEVGTIQPIRQIAQLIHKKRAERTRHLPATTYQLPLYLHTDAAQAANYLDLHVSRLGVDMMTINSGKIYGPKQSGALYVRTGVELAPLIAGGGQERGLRSGTENVTGIIGFSVALELAAEIRHEEVVRLQKLQQLFFDELEAKLPGVIINGSRKHRLPNNVHITLPGQDNERLLMALDEAGIMAAAGSACSASDEEPSHVLRAMGISDQDARASLRFTMGRGTTEAHIRAVVDALGRLVST